MNGRRAATGLVLICALALSGIAAVGASAAGTTAFTCKKKSPEVGAGFSKEHCDATDAVSSLAKFEHVEITPGTWTKFDASNEKTASNTTASTPWVTSGTVAGLKATITAQKITITGELQNFEDPSTHAMALQVRKLVFTSTEAVLSGALKTVEGCEVAGSTVTTKELSGTSLNNTMEIEFKPEAGETVAEIKLEKCKEKVLNETALPLTGTFKGISGGATWEFTVPTTAAMRLSGQGASTTGLATPRMITGTTLENPISTTTTTP